MGIEALRSTSVSYMPAGPIAPPPNPEALVKARVEQAPESNSPPLPPQTSGAVGAQDQRMASNPPANPPMPDPSQTTQASSPEQTAAARMRFDVARQQSGNSNMPVGNPVPESGQAAPPPENGGTGLSRTGTLMRNLMSEIQGAGERKQEPMQLVVA